MRFFAKSASLRGMRAGSRRTRIAAPPGRGDARAGL